MTAERALARRAGIILATARGDGGGERSLEELLRLLGRDFEVSLLVENHRHGQRCTTVLGERARVSRLPFRLQSLQVLYAVAWTLLRTALERPKFLLANTNKSGLILALAARLWPSIGRRAVLYIRDFQWRFLPFILRSLPDSLVLVPGEALVEKGAYLHPLLIHYRVRWAVVPNIASLGRAYGARAQASPVVLMLGGIQRWKGQDHLIRALSVVPAPLTVAFYGQVQEPDYFDEIRQLAGELDVAERVAFYPYTDQVPEIMSGALCVVVASVGEFGGPETFGRVILDAWAAEKPVVAFDVGGPHYLVRNEQTGLLVPEADWQSLGAALKRLWEDPVLAERLGKAGSAEIDAQYMPERIYDRFLKAMNCWSASSRSAANEVP